MPDYTYNLSGSEDALRIARVRKEIDDRTSVDPPVQGTDFFQTDADILDSLAQAQEEAPDDANEVEVRLMACAAILDTLATNQAYVLKKRRTMSDETDGPAVAKEIRSHATALRNRAKASLQSRRDAAAEAAAQAKLPAAPRSGGFGMAVRF